jgi:hypothetical protein
MAATGTVGILRALLTADASSFQKTMKTSADAASGFGKSVSKLGDTAQKVTPQLTRLEKSFSGDKLLYTANNLTRAITNIGGAAKLTAQEQEKVNRQLTTAIDKYRALGQQAPKAMLDLERATRKTEQAVGGVNTMMIALGSAVGSFVGNLAARGISTIVNLGTAALESAGQIADMSKRLGISAEAVQGFQFAAEQSGTTLEAMGTAINKLNINLAEGNKSTVGALEDLGLELVTLRNMKPEDAFLAVADAIAKIPDPMERARLGAELLGRGFAEISPAIQNDLRKTAEAASKMSAETVAALDKAGDALDQLKRDATVVAGSVIGWFYAMASAANAYASAATNAKTKSQEFEDVAARIRKSQSIPDLPPSPGLPTLPDLGGGPRGATPQEIALITRQAEALAKAAAAQQKWNEARARERQAIEDATQGMTWWLAGMKTVPETITSAADSLRSGFIPATQLSTKALEALMQTPSELAPNFVRVLQQVETYYSRVFVPAFVDGWDTISGAAGQAFGDMLVGLRGFKDGFLSIWNAIRQAFSNILAAMVQDFLQGFLRKALASMAGGALGGALGAGGGAAATTAATAVAGGAAGGTAAAGAGLGATIAGLATNPFTIAAAGALVLGLGIGKKGWFRGGEEGIAVNPARDTFLKQFGGPGTGEGSGFHTLASMLTNLTGQPGGGAPFRALMSADTMQEFSKATADIMLLLQRRGVSVPRPGGVSLRLPSNPLPALAAATAPVPVLTAPSAVLTLGATGAAPVTMNVTIQAWDRSDLNDAFRTEIIPRFKDALQFNQAGLRTAVADV